jgi:hypothetical protein
MKSMRYFYPTVALLLAAFSMVSLHSEEVSNPKKPVVTLALQVEIAKQSALDTQKTCMQFVQMNVFEFEECVSDRLKQKKISAADRLGITYMGFVGALSAQRMGSQGSHTMAWEYAKKSLKIQKKLGLKDNDLCDIVPGDCETRLARTTQILNSPAPVPLTEAEMASRHRH